MPWSENIVTLFNTVYEQFTIQGQRVVAFAELPLPGDLYPDDFDFDHRVLEIGSNPASFFLPIEGYHFVGMLSLMDPPRPGIRKAVSTCMNAGIQVVMMTGDHPLMAEVNV